MSTVSTKWDIVSLFEHYAGIQTKNSSVVHGVREVHANCPWCPGTTDSLILRPDTGQFSHAVRAGGCGRSGDGLDFLTQYVDMNVADAIQELGLDDVQFAAQDSATRRVNSSDIAPNITWQEAAELLVRWAEAYLWSGKPDAVIALEYLHKRGLRDETIKKARLGYVPLSEDGKWREESFAVWGIDPETLTEQQRAKGCVRIPDGILIPWYVGAAIWKLAMKRPGQEKMPYGQIMGSVDALYNVDGLQYGEICMMVEGELDCLSVQQEAGDQVNCVATGSTSKGRASRWITELMTLPSYVLQAFDSDAAGDEAANTWIDLIFAQPGSKIDTPSFCRDKFCKVERWPLVLWNDPNELLQAQIAGTTEGFTLRDWVELGVDIARNALEQEVGYDPLAREVQESIILDPLAGSGDFLGDIDEEEAPLPDAQEEDLVQFAHTISMIVNELGGPDRVQIHRHDGRTLDQTYPTIVKPYVPVTLPALPRTKCAHGMITQRRVSDEISAPKSGRTCIGKVLANGWCADHQDSQELLEIGAQLNYPEVMNLGTYRARGVGQGVACWEAAAERYGIEHIKQDIKQIKAKFGL